jgi:DNA-binding NtrC family response regulator
VHIPPLRERREDILWFTRLFLSELDTDSERYLLPSAEQQLLQYDWPGNLRELHHSIERASILTAEPGIGAAALINEAGDGPADSGSDLRDRLSHYEHQLILEALRRHDFQMNETAHELGISRKNLWEKIKKLGIERD